MKNDQTTILPLGKRGPIIDAIAEALHSIKSHQLPNYCDQLGLESGTKEEAFSSKRTYVKERLKKLDDHSIVGLAERVSKELSDYSLTEFLNHLQENINGQLVSELNRREILKSLNGLHLFGELDVQKKLGETFPQFVSAWQKQLEWGSISEEFTFWSNAELLEKAGAINCSQARFFSLLESIVSPNCHKGEAQIRLVNSLNKLLRLDGFVLQRAKVISGHPSFSVERLVGGVAGTPKNLIFAADGYKPDIVITDAINNDIKIVRNQESCLIYDRPIGEDGVSKGDLLSWWKDLMKIDDDVEARKSLVLRLGKSLSSQAEKNLFSTYYRMFKDKPDSFPALIPQVYLHYDPFTLKQLAGRKRLPRQRMDFLILFSGSIRVVLEVDGKHHFAEDETPSLPKYAEMMSADRDLRLSGYEVYRFGANELTGTNAVFVIEDFFQAFMNKYAQ